MCFFLKMLWFFLTLPVLLQRWFSTCLVCVHTLTPRKHIERPESGTFWNIRKKNTIFNEHPVSYVCLLFWFVTSKYCICLGNISLSRKCQNCRLRIGNIILKTLKSCQEEFNQGGSLLRNTEVTNALIGARKGNF